MQTARNEVPPKPGRSLRWRRARTIVSALGGILFLLGIIILFMTIHYTPEELARIASANPKWFMDSSLLFPAPAHFRAWGIALIVGGLAIVGVITARSDGNE